ncbi:SDR family oxidoreductase [Parafrankia sp. CH37]|uniref:SDR family oxidoreductase n=1 Tax=Parafrankia sp. CH37 TaxID=683308 RepID=UPI0028A0D02D|nr:SDR family oxidoreductase [Parafrankia sp. CH37]
MLALLVLVLLVLLVLVLVLVLLVLVRLALAVLAQSAAVRWRIRRGWWFRWFRWCGGDRHRRGARHRRGDGAPARHRGATVACLDVRIDQAEKTAAGIVEAGGAARAFACDVSDEESVAAAVRAVEDDLGAPRVLANVAGIGWFAHTAEQPSPTGAGSSTSTSPEPS